VPEAAVNKDRDTSTWQHEVRSTALGDLPVKPEPATTSVDRPTEEQLRLSVLFAAPSEMRAVHRADPPIRHLFNLRRPLPDALPLASTDSRFALGVWEMGGCVCPP